MNAIAVRHDWNAKKWCNILTRVAWEIGSKLTAPWRVLASDITCGGDSSCAPRPRASDPNIPESRFEWADVGKNDASRFNTI